MIVQSGLMQSKMASVVAFYVRRPTACCLGMFLLLIFIQMLTCQLVFAGVFILSDDILISPFRFCLKHQHGEIFCDNLYRSPVNGAEHEIKINILPTVVTLGLYIPVVLVAFALLAMLFAAYAKDSAALRCSMVCQAASSLLIPTGIVAFLLRNLTYVSLEHMTPWFYICVGVEVQLVITAALTCVSMRRLMSDWEEMTPNEKSSLPC